MKKTIDKPVQGCILPPNITDELSYNNFQSIAHAERVNGLNAIFQRDSVGRNVMFFI